MLWSFLAGIFIVEAVDDARQPLTDRKREANKQFVQFLWKWVFLPFAILFIISWMIDQVSAQTTQRTFQDSMGRNIGRSSTDARGNTTFYNERGQNTGRSSTDSRGTTTFYDNMGRQTGRSSK